MRQTAAPHSAVDALDQWGIQFPLLPDDPVELGPTSSSLAVAISSWRLSIPTLLPRRRDALDQWGIEFPIPVEQLAPFAGDRRSGCLAARTVVLGGRLRAISQAGAWAAILAVVVAGSALAVSVPASAGAAPPSGAPAGRSSGVIVEADATQIAILPSISERPSAISNPTPGPTPGATSSAEALAIKPASNIPASVVLEAPPFAVESISIPTIQNARDYLVARLGTRVDRHWGLAQSQCASLIFEYESGWDPHATNKTSGAYGLPQANPASKLANWSEAKASAAEKVGDPAAAWLYRAWRDNPVVQAEWGVDYMIERYGSPCAALAFRNGVGWY